MKITTFIVIFIVALFLSACSPSQEPKPMATLAATLTGKTNSTVTPYPEITATPAQTTTLHTLPPIEDFILSVDDLGDQKKDYPNGAETPPGLPQFDPDIQVNSILFQVFPSVDGGETGFSVILIISGSEDQAKKLQGIYSDNLELQQQTTTLPQADSLVISRLEDWVYCSFYHQNTFATFSFTRPELTIDQKLAFLERLCSIQYLKILDVYQ